MIQLENVWVTKGRFDILQNVNLQVEKSEFILLFGPSGAGKSTVLHLVHMDEKPTSGRVLVGEYDSSTIKQRHIPKLRRKVGFIFQDFKLLKDRTAFENVAFALTVTGEKRDTIVRRTMQALGLVSLSHKRGLYPNELSGGEKQRVAIARALVNEPSILLADEPTGDLDSSSVDDIIEILKDVNRKGTSVIMATHDENVVPKLTCRSLKIEGGRIVE